MSFSTKSPDGIIITGPEQGSPFAGARFVSDDPNITESGWDANTLRFFALKNPTPGEMAGMFPIGSQPLGNANWWTTGVRKVPAGAGTHFIEVTAKGWAATRPAKVTWTTAADQQSAENVATPAGTHDKVSTHEAAPAFTVSFLSADAAAISAEYQVGRAASLPVSAGGAAIPIPSVPATVWASLAEYVYHWPNGWVLLDLSADLIPGTTVGLINLSYKHIRDITPG